MDKLKPFTNLVGFSYIVNEQPWDLSGKNCVQGGTENKHHSTTTLGKTELYGWLNFKVHHTSDPWLHCECVAQFVRQG